MTFAPATGRIDVQFHFSPDFYTDMVEQLGGGHIVTRGWSVPKALEYFEKFNVAAGVLSVSTPGVDFLDAAESVALARRLNDAAAEVARGNPGRFGNFATLPMQDVDATLAEIAYCYDKLGMEGVCMMSNIKGKYLGHTDFAPVFDELNRRGAVIFIHPTDPAYMGPGAISPPLIQMASVAEWPFDTTRAAIDLMYSGTIARCPDISVILAHAGGALPMVSRRVISMSAFFGTEKSMAAIPRTKAEIGKFYYDLAISAGEHAIGAIRGVSDLDHVLFACDWPFAPDMAVAMNVAGFEGLKITPEERHAIERGNAARLFPNLVAA